MDSDDALDQLGEQPPDFIERAGRSGLRKWPKSGDGGVVPATPRGRPESMTGKQPAASHRASVRVDRRVSPQGLQPVRGFFRNTCGKYPSTLLYSRHYGRPCSKRTYPVVGDQPMRLFGNLVLPVAAGRPRRKTSTFKKRDNHGQPSRLSRGSDGAFGRQRRGLPQA